MLKIQVTRLQAFATQTRSLRTHKIAIAHFEDSLANAARQQLHLSAKPFVADKCDAFTAENKSLENTDGRLYYYRTINRNLVYSCFKGEWQCSKWSIKKDFIININTIGFCNM